MPGGGELEGQRAGAGADVERDEVARHHAGERTRAQRVVVPHLAQRVPLGADRIEEAAAARRARLEHARQREAVALGQRVGLEPAPGQRPRVRPRALRRALEAVERVGALAAVAQQAGLAQDAEVPGDAGLRHAERLHQLVHGELLALEQGQDPDAGRVAERAEDLLEEVGAQGGNPSGSWFHQGIQMDGC